MKEREILGDQNIHWSPSYIFSGRVRTSNPYDLHPWSQ